MNEPLQFNLGGYSFLLRAHWRDVALLFRVQVPGPLNEAEQELADDGAFFPLWTVQVLFFELSCFEGFER